MTDNANLRGTRRICLSSNTAWSLYNFRRSVICALLDRGYQIVVVAPRDSSSDALRKLGCTVRHISIDHRGTNPLRDIGSLTAYIRIFRDLRPDLILLFTIKPVIYGSIAASRLRIPCVNMVTGLGTAFASKNWITQVAIRLYRISQGHPSKIFFLNHEDKQVFSDLGLISPTYAGEPSASGSVASNLNSGHRFEVLETGSGIDLNWFAYTPDLQPETTFILAARMLREKGVEVYVEAARLIRRSNPSVRFQLLGPLATKGISAVTRDEINAWSAEGVIEYLGEAEDVRPFLGAASCVVLPSYYKEGVPRSLMEGAAMGRPAITTDNVGCRNVVDHEITGFLCRTRDPMDLAAKMALFIGMPVPARQKMGKMAREKMEREFDDRFVVSRYLHVVDEILGSGSAHLERKE
jgi:glycosyltransferase involved in cell wall biosynthesis